MPVLAAPCSLLARASASAHSRRPEAGVSGRMLTLRRTGLSSPAYQDSLDYIITEDGRDVGRLYEDRHSRPELQWFWSITVYVDPKLGIRTSGRAASLEAAKAQFLTNWQKCRADSTPPPRPSM
jgi:hypothetical protein